MFGASSLNTAYLGTCRTALVHGITKHQPKLPLSPECASTSWCSAGPTAAENAKEEANSLREREIIRKEPSSCTGEGSYTYFLQLFSRLGLGGIQAKSSQSCPKPEGKTLLKPPKCTGTFLLTKLSAAVEEGCCSQSDCGQSCECCELNGNLLWCCTVWHYWMVHLSVLCLTIPCPCLGTAFTGLAA